MELDGLVWDGPPTLRRPILVAGFRGWNDAGNAASDATDWLAARLSARLFGRIEAEPYFDFQSTRPEVVLTAGVVREIVWPANEFLAGATAPAAHDIIVLRGVEPNLRWRSFCATVVHVAQRSGCELVVTLGALLAEVPHTRVVRVTGTATDPELIRRLGLERSRYEGPTGIVGVLHDACRAAGLASASLWAPVPHYVAAPPHPVATRELVTRFADVAGITTDVTVLDQASAAWRDQVDEIVAADDDATAYVRRLEEQHEQDAARETDADLPSGDELAAEFEQYLRDERGEG